MGGPVPGKHESEQDAPDPGRTVEVPPRVPAEAAQARTTVDVPAAVAAGVPRRIGRYAIKRLIGAGGMGAVYEAVQEQPRRVVALKVMKEGIASRSALRRFEYEAQLLGRLRHPGIAQVYEAGTHVEHGVGGGGTVPFFAMEYIPGARPITVHVRERKLTIRERLALFGKVCDAVHFGHTKGVIHRDLKPANILVESSLAVADQPDPALGARADAGSTERIGQPKIIDFGVARATDSDLALTTMQTDVGQLIGTLQYMSPEQAGAGPSGGDGSGEGPDPHDIDTRSDVYALGVVLYELLCEQLPYDVSRSAIFDATRVIREQAPARLSTINRMLRGDVETITLKALEKDRERRYRSAADLADDIRRYLRSEPIQARPPTVAYQVRMLARRNRPLVAAAGAVLAALVLALIGISIFAVRAEGQRRLASAEAYVARLAAAQSALILNDVRSAASQLEAAPPALRSWEWGHLQSRLDLSLASMGDPGLGPVYACLAVPGSDLLLSGHHDGRVRCWNTGTGAEVGAWPAHQGPVHALAISADGAVLATGGADGAIHLWHVADRQKIATLTGHRGPVRCLAFSPSGTALASGGDDTLIRGWNVASGAVEAEFAGHSSPVESLAFTPDGRTLASASADLTARLWDAATGEPLAKFVDNGAVFAVAVGERVVNRQTGERRTFCAFGGATCTITVVDVAERRVVRAIRGHDYRIQRLAFSPDGARLASASYDRTVRVWDTSDWRQSAVLRGHMEAVFDCGFSSDGQSLVSASSDGTARRWDVRSQSDVPNLDAYWDTVFAVAVSPDGNMFAAGSADQPVRLWDVRTIGLQGAMMAQRKVNSLAFVGGGLAIGGADGTIQWWDVRRQVKLAEATPARSAGALPEVGVVGLASLGSSGAASPALVSLGADGMICTWASPPGTPLRTWSLGEAGVALSAGGEPRMVVAVGRAGRVVQLDEQLRPQREFRAVGSVVRAAAYDGRQGRVAIAADGAGVRVYGLANGDEVDRASPGTQVGALAFAADGTRLFLGTAEGAIIVRDPAGRRDLLPLLGHQLPVTVLAVSPDGATVVSGSDDTWIRVWSTVPARRRELAASAARQTERRLNPLVNGLFEEIGTQSAVVDRLLADLSLPTADREVALAMARTRAANHFGANWDAWQAVKTPGLAKEEYERALRRVRIALQFMPDDGNYINTLGVAQYRLGEFEAAAATLRRSAAINEAAPADRYPFGAFPADYAFLALSLRQAGRTDEAAAALARFREVAADRKWRTDEETLAFAKEVEAAFGQAGAPGGGGGGG